MLSIHKTSLLERTFRPGEDFKRLARFTLMDALRELPEAEAVQCFQVEELITWEVISHKLPGRD